SSMHASPQESQPSGQSYFKYCAIACKLMKSRKQSHHFLHTPLFFNGLITINGYQSINRSRDWENIMSRPLFVLEVVRKDFVHKII
ncbi:hypothetical protein, partial [Staphylococcus pseudintermedius]|uniref:hypothetical protein n=1 Tax=Staphylococcus pseudintermedius TaxID=283734 RepID=UPI001C6E1720